MKRNKNGITLIALIITIIVMLILVGVTINLSANGELFAKARTASADTEKHKILEELIQNADFNNEGEIDVEELIGKVKSKYGNVEYADTGKLTITGNKGTYEYKVTKTEIDLWKDLIKSYILGENEEGKTFFKDEGDDGIFNNKKKEFIDPPQGLGYLAEIAALEENPEIIYIKYDNKAYKITVNKDTNKSEKLELIYEPKGKEGEKTEDGWTIIYDNGETVEAVSPTASDDELQLAYRIIDNKVDESIESYNNAIALINDYCKNLEGLPTNEGVRSVGASKETDDKDPNNYYTSSNLEYFSSKYIGKCKKGDTYYEQDLIRMAYWDVACLEQSYWVASRIVEDGHEGVNFNVVTASSEEVITCEGIWWLCYGWSSGEAEEEGYDISLPVRPIITIKNT